MATPSQSNPEVSAQPLVRTLNDCRTLQIADSRVIELAGAAASGGRAYVFIEESLPGAGPPLHRHAHEDEYFFVLEGRYKWVMDGREFTGEAGAFVLAPSGSTHTFTNLGPGRGRMLLVTVPSARNAPSTLEQAFHKVDAACRKGPVSPDEFARLFASAGITFHGPPLGGPKDGQA